MDKPYIGQQFHMDYCTWLTHLAVQNNLSGFDFQSCILLPEGLNVEKNLRMFFCSVI